ncbi:hypothetical protein [Parasitella parasitica]|uniref:AB hydrolase-1 domain-containing protein n=1 Tax=Parasitella parasitica TaxID=35722 RepID=A0A0B7N9P5_9FUNG|nr:hypothetical protein [Parasitella parasitica]
MEFSGDLFQYDEKDRLNAFETSPNSEKTVVFIGGLGDGFNSVPFLPSLFESISKLGWSLTQVQLSSSVDGFGTSDLQTDSKQLDTLVRYLQSKRQKKKIVFIGHSTGFQDCYWHNKNGECNQAVSGYILQAPCSDRQYLASLKNYQEYLVVSSKMRAYGVGREIMPRDAHWSPITADRYYSLAAKHGDDDVFSTDFTDQEIKELFQGVDRPIVWVYGEKDEYYMPSNGDAMKNIERFMSLVPAIKGGHLVANADHCINDKVAQQDFCKIVSDYLISLDK